MADGRRAVHRQAQSGLRALWRLRPADAAGGMVRPQMSLAARLFLDLGRIKERGNDCGRADSDRNARLHQLCPPLFARFVAVVAHGPSSMAFGAALEAA